MQSQPPDHPPSPEPPTDRPDDCHFKPHLQEVLRELRVDVRYERGEGDYLYCRRDDGTELQVLDLVGGYGSLLLGHSHPALVAEARRLLAGQCPIHAQGSRREPAARLAAELSRRAGGDYLAVFGNSGAEAVEAAIKHALLETGGRTFIVLERAFHGKTLGALQLTASVAYREPFERGGLKALRVPANDIAALEAAFARAAGLAGFLFEPVQGEGGVHPLEPAFVRRAAALCGEHGVPLIADECQTGLGRTGRFLACEEFGVRPDYLVLSKALGGGIAKISALLVRRDRYRPQFDLLHTSTFADDDFSSTIALRTLELIDERLLAACRDQGTRLLDGLRQLAADHPAAIADVRGRGLMLAVEFRRLDHSPSFFLRVASNQRVLAPMLTGYLLNVHGVRVAATLSDPFTLRLQPSALIGSAGIGRLLGALDELCSRLSARDIPALSRFLVADPRRQAPVVDAAASGRRWLVYDEAAFRRRQRPTVARKVAWLGHLIDAGDLASLEPAMAELPRPEQEALLERVVRWLPPVVMSGVDLASVTGERLRFYPILLPFTSRWVKCRIDRRQLDLPRAMIRQGIEAARTLGCSIVSLGQFTSIATLSGTRAGVGGIGLTTGNSYAIALALQAIERSHRETGTTPAGCDLVIVGAAGNIGRTCATILAPRYRTTILVGSDRPGSWRRLSAFAAGIPNARPSRDPGDLARGAVVVAALNAVDAPLDPARLAPGAIVCDLSVPAALPADAGLARPDLHLIKGGLVALPGGEDLGIVGFPLPRGQAYGCMAEAMLLGWEGVADRSFTGSLTADQVRRVAAMAERHGFRLADYRRSCVLGSEPRE